MNVLLTSVVELGLEETANVSLGGLGTLNLEVLKASKI